MLCGAQDVKKGPLRGASFGVVLRTEQQEEHPWPRHPGCSSCCCGLTSRSERGFLLRAGFRCGFGEFDVAGGLGASPVDVQAARGEGGLKPLEAV